MGLLKIKLLPEKMGAYEVEDCAYKSRAYSKRKHYHMDVEGSLVKGREHG